MSHTTSPPTQTPFTRFQRRAFDVVTRTMGFAATWNSETVNVGFRNPTEEMRLAGVDYDPSAWTMEYRDDQFVGLEAAASARNSAEIVEIEGQEYWVRKVSRRLDGRSFLAELQPRPASFTPPAAPDNDTP